MTFKLSNHQAIDYIKKMSKEVVQFAVDSGLVTVQPERFKAEFMLNQTTKSCWSGGINNGRPIVSFTLAEHYIDFNGYINTFKADYERGVRYKEREWNIAAEMAVKHGVYYKVEYSNVSRKPGIGSYHAKDIKHALLGVITHEIAHAIQHWTFWNNQYKPRGYEGKPHGLFWQRIYLALRNEFVNNYQTKQEEPLQLAAETKKPTTFKPMRLTTAFKQAGFKPSKVQWDKKIKANRICALFDGKKSMVALQIQGEGKYQIYDVTVPDYLDTKPLLEVTAKEGQLLLDFLNGENK